MLNRLICLSCVSIQIMYTTTNKQLWHECMIWPSEDVRTSYTLHRCIILSALMWYKHIYEYPKFQENWWKLSWVGVWKQKQQPFFTNNIPLPYTNKSEFYQNKQSLKLLKKIHDWKRKKFPFLETKSHNSIMINRNVLKKC